MKLSKSILTAVIAGTTVMATATSCEKERFEDLKNGNNENGVILPADEDTQKDSSPIVNYGNCPACGMG